MIYSLFPVNHIDTSPVMCVCEVMYVEEGELCVPLLCVRGVNSYTMSLSGVTPNKSVHPSIHFLYGLIQFRVAGGWCPTCLRFVCGGAANCIKVGSAELYTADAVSRPVDFLVTC